MNYYYPYFTSIPYTQASSGAGLFSKLFGGGINFSSILSGTQKTLNIINQTIPLIKQASPIIKNAKSMFKIMNEFKKVDTPDTDIAKQNEVLGENEVKKEENTNLSSGPTFFL